MYCMALISKTQRQAKQTRNQKGKNSFDKVGLPQLRYTKYVCVVWRGEFTIQTSPIRVLRVSHAVYTLMFLHTIPFFLISFAPTACCCVTYLNTLAGSFSMSIYNGERRGRNGCFPQKQVCVCVAITNCQLPMGSLLTLYEM